MMKNINLLLTLVLIVFFISCDHRDPNKGKFESNPNSGYVAFNDSSYVVSSDLDTVRVPVNIEAPVNENGLTVTLDAEITTGEEAGTNIGPLNLNFPPGTLQDSLAIPINRDLGDYDVLLEIISTSRNDVSIGIEDNMSITVSNVNICGQFNSAYSGSVTSDLLDEEDEPFTFETSIVSNNTISEESGFCIYRSPSLWGENFIPTVTDDDRNTGFPYQARLEFNPNDNSVEVIPSGSNNNPGGSGTYDPSSGVINLTLQQSLLGSAPVNVTLSPMPQ